MAQALDDAVIRRPLGAALAIGAFATSLWMTFARAESPANVHVVELRQTEASLRETYAKGKRMMLPRLVMLDGKGRLVYGETGLSGGLDRRLHEALRKDKPVATPITLDAILAESENYDGQHVASASLPQADAYVIDWWAQWCKPCHEMARDLTGILARWSDTRFVWLKIESDPEKTGKDGGA
jgi:hypothetical protein